MYEVLSSTPSIGTKQENRRDGGRLGGLRGPHARKRLSHGRMAKAPGHSGAALSEVDPVVMSVSTWLFASGFALGLFFLSATFFMVEITPSSEAL